MARSISGIASDGRPENVQMLPRHARASEEFGFKDSAISASDFAPVKSFSNVATNDATIRPSGSSGSALIA